MPLRTSRIFSTGAAASITLLALTCAGCGDMSEDKYLGGPGGQLSIAEMQERPTLSEVAPRYEQLLADVRKAIHEVLPDAEMIQSREPMKIGCSSEVDSEEHFQAAKRQSYPGWVVSIRPTPEQWSQIRARLEPLLRDSGFEEVSMDAEIGNGGRRFVVQDELGAEFTIGYVKEMSMRILSGCHLDRT